MSSDNQASKRRICFDRIISNFVRDATVKLRLPPSPCASPKPNPKFGNPNALLTSAEAAEVLAIAKHTLENWRTTGERALPFVRIGNQVRYRMSELETFVEANTFGSTSEYGERPCKR